MTTPRRALVLTHFDAEGHPVEPEDPAPLPEDPTPFAAWIPLAASCLDPIGIEVNTLHLAYLDAQDHHLANLLDVEPNASRNRARDYLARTGNRSSLGARGFPTGLAGRLDKHLVWGRVVGGVPDVPRPRLNA